MTFNWLIAGLVWGGADLVTLVGSGPVVGFLLQRAGKVIPEEEKNPGRVIGKLENVLVLSFVAAGEFTGLAIIFAAKAIVRTPKGEADASYYILVEAFRVALRSPGVADESRHKSPSRGNLPP